MWWKSNFSNPLGNCFSVHSPSCGFIEYSLQKLESLMYDYSKDVRLPVQLQRAMAAEAEAAREARAKVISNYSIITFE